MAPAGRGEMAHRVYQGKEREKETKKEREKKREKRKREREKEGERQREKGERKKREKKERRERKTEKEKKEVSMYIRTCTYYTHQWHFSYLQFLCSMPPFLMWPISSLHSLLDFQCKNHMDIHRYMYYLSVSVIKLNAS